MYCNIMKKKDGTKLGKLAISVLLSLFLITTFPSAGLSYQYPPGFRDRETLLRDFFSLMHLYPTLMTYESIGKSYQGRDIPMFKIGNPNGGKIFFNMAVHGEEVNGPEVGYYMAKWILERREPDIANSILEHNLVMIVIENIDSYMIKRKNMHLYGYVQGTDPNLYGVDLNRNMPTGWGGSGSSSNVTNMCYKGPSPASEPESQALIRVFETYKPRFQLDYHAGGGFVFGKPSPYAGMSASMSQYHDVIANKIRTLAESRGVAVFPYGQLGIGGCVADQAYVSANSTSYLIEDGYSISAPAYDQIESIYMPRLLPFLIIFAQESEVTEKLFEDSFESGDFSAWDGTRTTAGETATVVNDTYCHGTHSAMFTSNGTGGFEGTYCYKTIPSSTELYTRGYLRVLTSGIADNDARFYFIRFMAESNSVAYAGWRKTSGTLRWSLIIRDGTSWATAHSAATPLLNRWYCVELHWKKDAANGLGELWVDGTLACSITGKNTSAFGDINFVRFGLAEIVNCGPTQVYGDCCVTSKTYIGQEPPSTIFEDGFESGSFSAWNGTRTTTGETATVVDTVYYQGTHSAMFTSDGTGWFEGAYCYVTVPSSSGLYARGYFGVSSSGIAEDNDRFYFIIFRAGANGVAYAGWRQVGGVIRWNLIIRDGTNWATAYSSSSPSPNKWYCLELLWFKDSKNGHAELYVDGVLLCSIKDKDTNTLGDINQVRFGLAELYNCRNTIVYCDSCKIFKVTPEFFPPWDLNQDGKVDIKDLVIVAEAYGSTPESSIWNPRADLNADGIVDMMDISIVATHYGEHYT